MSGNTPVNNTNIIFSDLRTKEVMKDSLKVVYWVQIIYLLANLEEQNLKMILKFPLIMHHLFLLTLIL